MKRAARGDGATNTVYLAIDSSTTRGTIAVGSPGAVLAEVAVSVRAMHSSALLPAIDHAVATARIERDRIGAVIVGAGPGSFTGVRIAAATAKGIVMALGVPFYAYSSLLAAAVPAAVAPGTVCAVFDARGRDVFAAAYAFDPRPRASLAPAALSVDDLIVHLRKLGSAVVVGDGAAKHRSELESVPGVVVADSRFGYPDAAGLIWLAGVDPDAGLVDSPASWEPSYLRASGAERIAAARAGSEADR